MADETHGEGAVRAAVGRIGSSGNLRVHAPWPTTTHEMFKHLWLDHAWSNDEIIENAPLAAWVGWHFVEHQIRGAKTDHRHSGSSPLPAASPCPVTTERKDSNEQTRGGECSAQPAGSVVCRPTLSRRY
jgi:hypothetical protein